MPLPELPSSFLSLFQATLRATGGDKDAALALLRDSFAELIDSEASLRALAKILAAAQRSTPSPRMLDYCRELPGIAGAFAASGNMIEALRVVATGVSLAPPLTWDLVEAALGVFLPPSKGDNAQIAKPARRLSQLGVDMLQDGVAEGITLIGVAHRADPGVRLPVKKIRAGIEALPSRDVRSMSAEGTRALVRDAVALEANGQDMAALRLRMLATMLRPDHGDALARLEAERGAKDKPAFKMSRQILERGYAAEAAGLLVDADAVALERMDPVAGPAAKPETKSSKRGTRGKRETAEFRTTIEGIDGADLESMQAGLEGMQPEGVQHQGAEPPGTEVGEGGHAPAPQPTFFFLLEGNGVSNDEVLWESAFDLIFNYDTPPPDALARIGGKEIEQLRDKLVTLTVGIVPIGFEVTDGVVSRIVKFKDGKLLGQPPRFHLQAPAKGTAPPESGGFGVNITFKIDRAEFREFFLPVHPVEAHTGRAYAAPGLELDPVEAAAAGLVPRDATVRIWREGDVWRIGWEIGGKEEPGRRTDGLTASALKEAYAEAGILEALNEIAASQIWKFIEDDLTVSKALQKAADDCMQSAAMAGWRLRKHLDQDAVFKDVLGRIEKLPDGSKITIKTDQTVFPWELLYSDEYLEGVTPGPVDVSRFWGARFQIESIAIQTDDLPPLPLKRRQEGAFRVSMALNPSIDAEWQGLGLDDTGSKPLPVQLHRTYCDTVLKSGAVYSEDYEKIVQIFTEAQAASMIYCYCHGSAKELVFDATRKPVTPDHVRNGPRSYQGWPIVFLNACSAAAISPLGFLGFRNEFHKKKAFGVIAPSCHVPIMFAALFARRLIEDYKTGDRPIGACLFDLRRELLGRNIPLGLWYSLQCPLDVTAPAAGG